MKKHIRKRKKQETIILKLAIKKNCINKETAKKELYWECYTQTGRKEHYSNHGFTEYYKELHFCTVDYFGEADEHSFTDYLMEYFAVYPDNWDEESYPDYPTRKELILKMRSISPLENPIFVGSL